MVGDDLRLSQVIKNLLTNAVKYTRKGSVSLTVREKSRDDESILLYVSVEDTGIGIREEDLPKLFESFERLDAVKNHGIEGTGLGMSIVAELLKLMGSEIHVKSEYGKGSTFSFVVRQGISDDTPIGDYSERLASSRVECNRELFKAEDAHILVVDDNDMNLKVATKLLSLFGITPDLTGSGGEALEILTGKSYHIIFLDHMMPKMDGIETLSKMKSEKLLHDGTKVIALTANAVKGARKRYLSSDFDDYLSKPIELGQLEEMLKKWLPKDIIRAGKTRQNAKTSTDENRDNLNDDEILAFAPDSSDDFENLSSENAPDNSLIGKLKSAGLEADSALRFCGGDIAFYGNILADYVTGFPDIRKKLSAYMEEDGSSAHDFEVTVHALKSASKTIGAVNFSQKALSLEESAKNNNDEFIRELLPSFLTEYQELVEAIQSCLYQQGDK